MALPSVDRMPRQFLRALAEHVGILPSYVDQSGRTRRTSDATRIALLAAMGMEAGREAQARSALEALREQNRAEILPAARVATAAAARTLVPHLQTRAVRTWSIAVRCEDGTTLQATGRRAIRLPPLPLGYHRLRLAVTTDGGGERVAEQRLIIVPPRCPTPRERFGARRVYGLLANLYTARSARNWGFGDLSDLERLVGWAADIGAAFVGVNPLHALANRGNQISPYSPVSRLYRNILYLDVTAAPEWGELGGEQRRRLASAGALGRLRAADRLDYPAVRALKWPAFVALHRVFTARHAGRTTARGRAYARYVASEGEPLRDFATFMALGEEFERQGRPPRRWPAPFRHVRSAAVRDFQVARRETVDRHCYLQFELDRQLGGVAEAARAHGLALGVYQDLALGSSRRGSDPWAFPCLFFNRIDIGAPPDNYAPTGQNWGLPPVDPRALAASGYEYWIRLLRAVLRGAGALRIDHVMGLFRQYWIPAGGTGADGAYVRLPADDLLGILALESRRAGALVIGEDLGTVPRGLPATLARQSILSTRVLYFERTRGGSFRPSRAYPRRALVGANTHDLVPLAGFWDGADLTLRRRVGLLRTAGELAAARAARTRERRALLGRLRREGVLPASGGEPGGVELCCAVHAFLARTPAVLAGVSLDDLTGERTPVNQPGAPLARYPSWSRRMRLALEALPGDPEVRRRLDALPTGPRAHFRSARSVLQPGAARHRR